MFLVCIYSAREPRTRGARRQNMALDAAGSTPSPQLPFMCPVCFRRDLTVAPVLYPGCRSFHLISLCTPPVREDVTPAATPVYLGACSIPTTWVPLVLHSHRPYNHDTSLLEFSLPNGCSLGLPFGSFLHVVAPGSAHDGGDAVRAYTAVSPPSHQGSFTMLVKRYDAWGDARYPWNFKPPGCVSTYLHSLAAGDSVLFRHSAAACRPGLAASLASATHLTLIAVGAGVAAIVQTLHHIIAGWDASDARPESGSSTEATWPPPPPGVHPSLTASVQFVTLIYGARLVEDLLLRAQLEAWAARTWAGQHRFRVVFVIGTRYGKFHVHRDDCPAGCKVVHPPPDPLGFDALPTDGGRAKAQGWVNADVIATYAAAPPGPASLVLVCGLPGVYDVVCGPRDEPGVRPGSALATLGYSDDMVVKL